MENSQHVKAFNSDAKSKNRLRYISGKERAKKASADVYRSYKRRTGVVTSAASREERVHHQDQFGYVKPRKTKKTFRRGNDLKVAIRATEIDCGDDHDDLIEIDSNTTFAMELDLTRDRNISPLFLKMYFELTPLVGSLPEVLHHSKKIISLLLSYLLSPASDPSVPSREVDWMNEKCPKKSFVVNFVTADILHLISVLARDLRHEIHPYVDKWIMPRIINDLINPPTTLGDDLIEETRSHQQRQLDVTIIETAFRTMSYIFRYDISAILPGERSKQKTTVGSDEPGPCLESLRKYYGATLAHKQDFVRRLAAEAFAPLIRKLKSDKRRRKHIRRVLNALAVSATGALIHHNPEYPTQELYSDRPTKNAIDGVSNFLFFMVRGVPGRLHSKGKGLIIVILDILSDIGNSKKKESRGSSQQQSDVHTCKSEVVCLVVSDFFSHLCNHMNHGPSFAPIWDSICDAIMREANEANLSPLCLGHVIRLIIECISFRLLSASKEGKSHERLEEASVEKISQTLHYLLEKSFFEKVGKKVQDLILRFVCVSWRVCPNHHALTSKLCHFLPCLAEGAIEKFDIASTMKSSNPIIVIARDLLPHLSDSMANDHFLPSFFRAATARAKQGDKIGALIIIHTIATSRRDNCDELNENELDDKDDFFRNKGFSASVISKLERSTLINQCFYEPNTLHNEDEIKIDCAQIGLAAKVLPFLLNLQYEEKANADDIFKKTFKWILGSTEKLSKVGTTNFPDKPEIVVCKSLLLESLAHILSQSHNQPPEKVLRKAKNLSEELLFQSSTSICATRAVACMSEVFHEKNMTMNDKSNEVFDLLIPNLNSSSHFLRLHSLRILNTYPQLPFIVDHSELERLSGDLDEESDFQQEKNQEEGHHSESQNNIISSTKGMCDLMNILLHIETAPVNMANERELTSAISRVEVLARTGKLPIVYAEAAASHMFGIMHTKYQPIWKFVVQVIVILASSQEQIVWPRLEFQLKHVMKEGFFDETDDIKEQTMGDSILQDQELLVAWDCSCGVDARIFTSQILEARRLGRVCRHQTADKMTIFELVWSVLEGVPQVISKKSKIIVPIFFDFLESQYFSFYDDDSDVREFALEKTFEKESMQWSNNWPREKLGRKMLQKKLMSFMKMFAEVKGMKHLYCYSTLQLKHAYLTPYAEHLNGILKKGQLRETLTKFNISEECGAVDVQDRNMLFPIVIRMLFGRLSARSTGSKSSKDSPTARRAAIFSFLSGLDETKYELDYVVYMMVRPFIPRNVDMTLSKCGHFDFKRVRHILNEVKGNISVEEVSRVQNQRQEGFLNLLSDVIKKLGFGVKVFVPLFMEIILSLINNTEKFRKNSKLDCPRPDGQGEHESPNNRAGKVRNLCFRRLSDLMIQFASDHDFTQFSEQLWNTLKPAVTHLPESVVNADKAPSLLILLESITSHPKLLRLLHEDDQCLQPVFTCISGNIQEDVLDNCLKFINNLLTEGGLYEDSIDYLSETSQPRFGVGLLLKHVDLLIEKFTERLDSGSCDFTRTSRLACRELDILCKVSKLLFQRDSVYTDKHKSGDVDVMEKLAKLLVPFLSFERKVSEASQIDILRILNSILPRTKPASALSHLQSLSKLLGPNKANAGIVSLEVRQNIVSCIEAISQSSVILQPMTNSLKSLNSSHPKHVEEHNFDEILPILNGLGGDNPNLGWEHYLCQSENFIKDDDLQFDNIKVLLPLMYCCLHLLYDSDGVLSRGAFKAIHTLITVSSDKHSSLDDLKQGTSWLRLIETALVPNIRTGLKTAIIPVRRYFILLLANVSGNFLTYESPHLYGDLRSLIREDDQELDFFLNITHVQIHRRGRALTRLRKLLSGNIMHESQFSMQSLANILLPLAIHPIYESMTTKEEPYALEAIATVGAIAKHLSWSKYQNTLWTALLQLPRYGGQEKYLIPMICSIVDSFHFHLSDENEDGTGNGILMQLKKRIIPKIESYLLKEKIENHRHSKTLRSPIVLTLIKLFQKLPTHLFEAKLSNLLTVLCNALKEKDSNERDVARITLSKIACLIDTKYLADIIRELAISLSEGYQLHVRSSCLHSILLALSTVQDDQTSIDPIPSPFDSCVPALMDLIQQDIFGRASEMKEAEEVQKRVIKEAIGVKSYSSIEIISRLILFKPSLVSLPGNISSIHVMVNPLLKRLNDPEVDSSTIGKVGECLNRMNIGIAHNITTTADEMLPFIHAVISPYIGLEEVKVDDDCSLDDSDDEEVVPKLTVSRSSLSRKKIECSMDQTNSVKKVFEWAPSQLNNPKNNKAANLMKKADQLRLRKVQDGVNVPRLTGTSRNAILKSSSRDINDPASLSAVSFGLSLLHSFLKKSKLNGKEEMAEPFVGILTECVRYSKDTNAIIMSLKNLQYLLRLDLTSVPMYRKKLGEYTLHQLSNCGLSSTRNELTQSCFKTLTLLLTDRLNAIKYLDVKNGGEEEFSHLSTKLKQSEQSNGQLPLNKLQMKVLVSILHNAVTDSVHQNATFSCIKAISSRIYTSPEYYDLIEKILELSVQSQKQTVRQQCSRIFMQYFVEYPMGKVRVENHLKQITLNIKYEYEDGRVSGIALLIAVIEKLPIPLLEEYTKLFFLPLVLQLVNDESKKCREMVARCISSLIKRLSTEVLQSLYEYALRWASSMKGSETYHLRCTSCHLFGIFINSRFDFMKRSGRIPKLVDYLHECLDEEIGSIDHTDIIHSKQWEMCYFSLQTLEILIEKIPQMTFSKLGLWTSVIKCLVHPHPWIKISSSRIIYSTFSNIESSKFAAEHQHCASSIILNIPGSLFDIARNTCFQLNSEEEHQTEAQSTMATKNLAWLINIMDKYPKLCFHDSMILKLSSESENPIETDKEDSDGDGNDRSRLSTDPVRWLIVRLSNIAKRRGVLRRDATFKCFAAFAMKCDAKILVRNLQPMMEPLNRVIEDVANKKEGLSLKRYRNRELEERVAQEADLAKEVMNLLEDAIGSDTFVRSLADVKTQARERRETRKQELAAQSITDPEGAAERKIFKQNKEKKRRKRRVEERRSSRGVFTKKPRYQS